MLFICSMGWALTFEEAWEATQQNSATLALVHEQVVQARGYRTQAFAAVLPQVSLTGNYIINDHETTADLGSGLFDALPPEFAPLFEGVEIPPIVLEEKAYPTLEIQVVQPLLNGQAIPGLRAVGQNLQAAEAEEQSIRSQLRGGLAKAWYGTLLAREGERLAGEALAQARKHAEQVEVQVATGVAAPTARLQAQLAVTRAQREVAAARAGVVQAESALRTLMGATPEIEQALAGELAMPETPALPFGSLEEALAGLSGRQDLAAAEHRSAAAAASRTISYMGWAPSLNGVFRYNQSPETGFNPDGSRWRLILNAQWNLWDGGMRIGANQVAASQYRQATEAERKAREEAEQQIRVAWERYQQSLATLTLVEEEASLAAENLRLAEAAWGAGTLTFLELEDARLGLKASRMALAAERANRDLAIIDLLVATGRW